MPPMSPRMLTASTTVEEAVFEAVGAASVCWEHMQGTGIFDSDRAKAIGDELVDRIREDRRQPRLGFATTKQLIDELAARADVAKTIGEAWPGYIPVGSE